MSANSSSSKPSSNMPPLPNGAPPSSSLGLSTGATVGIAATAVVVVAAAVLWRVSRFNTLAVRYATAKDLPEARVNRNGTGGPLRLTGYVVSVGDSDGFRFFHTPALRWYSEADIPGPAKCSEVTISVRIAGTDCPEAAHFGMPAQPYSLEAYEYTLSKLMPGATIKPGTTKFLRGGPAPPAPPSSSLLPQSNNDDTPVRGGGRHAFVGGKLGLVRVDIYRVDQYGRVVAMPYYRPYPRLLPFLWRNLSLDLLKEGLGTVYTQRGAEYGGMKDKFMAAQDKARRAKKGIWSDPNYVMPAEFKRAGRANGGAAGAPTAAE
ncbi:putative endonuclease lcl3 [Blastocladiella emersonii ATCC 22665]|nr:putative endonuclease lcl3 [Blastocladiella emersonii ATCC 22665]